MVKLGPEDRVPSFVDPVPLLFVVVIQGFAKKCKRRLKGRRWILLCALYKYQKSEGKINNVNKNLHCCLFEVPIAQSLRVTRSL